jgi:hypothetical protein
MREKRAMLDEEEKEGDKRITHETWRSRATQPWC